MKKLVLLSILSLALVTATAALNIDVEVAGITEMDAAFLKYKNNTADFQRINLSAENTGSIGCEYRLKGVFHYRNSTEIRYSKPYSLWPGELASPQLYFVTENYTGKVKVEVHSYFCERQEFVRNITYTQTGLQRADEKVESETLEANETTVKVGLQQDNGFLVPQDTPEFWKTSSARIRNGTASIRYEPPIFDSRKKLNYTVLERNGEVSGYTTIPLEVEESYWSRIKQRLPRILGILVFFLVILNTRLLLDKYVRERD